jgi:hypothetical protein
MSKYEPFKCERCHAPDCEHLRGRAEPLYVYGYSVAPEWLLDECYPDEAKFAEQKARVLTWVTRQPKPVSIIAITEARWGPGRDEHCWGGRAAIVALVAESALVKIGTRYYAPLKVTVRGKTFHTEPNSVKKWRARDNKTARRPLPSIYGGSYK